MPRYAPEALKLMAVIVAADDAEGGEKSLRLYTAVAIRIGMDMREVRRVILEHAADA